MVWQHVASVAAATTAKHLGGGSVGSAVGHAALAAGWAGFAALAITAVGVVVLVLSIRVLDSLEVD